MKTLHSSLLFFSAALLLNHPCTGAPGQWEETGSMVYGRAEQTATLMSNGDVLVIGGITGGSLSSAERYNPIRGTWSKIASLPKGISGHSATLLPNGKVLVAGGLRVQCTGHVSYSIRRAEPGRTLAISTSRTRDTRRHCCPTARCSSPADLMRVLAIRRRARNSTIRSPAPGQLPGA